jgi:hypothetical protein
VRPKKKLTELALDDPPHDVVDGARGVQIVNPNNRVLPANAVRAVLGLDHQPGSPVQLRKHDVASRVQRQTDAGGFVTSSDKIGEEKSTKKTAQKDPDQDSPVIPSSRTTAGEEAKDAEEGDRVEVP